MNLEEFTGEPRGSDAYFAMLNASVTKFQRSVWGVVPNGVLPDGTMMMGEYNRKNPEGAKTFMKILSSLDLSNPAERDLLATALEGSSNVFLGLVRSGQDGELLAFMSSLAPPDDPKASLMRAFLADAKWYYSEEVRESAAFKAMEARVSEADGLGTRAVAPGRPGTPRPDLDVTTEPR